MDHERSYWELFCIDVLSGAKARKRQKPTRGKRLDNREERKILRNWHGRTYTSNQSAYERTITLET
jgi:hypothetical protein